MIESRVNGKHEANGHSKGKPTERMPPADIRAEWSVLGGCLRWPEAIGDVAQILQPKDFYKDAHQIIFRAMLQLYQEGQPVDVVSLANALRNNQGIENIGGYKYLAALLKYEPTGAQAVYHAQIVRDASVCRQLIHEGTAIVRDAFDRRSSSQEILEEAERKVFAIAQGALADTTCDLEAILNAACDRIDQRSHKTGSTGVLTGFCDLDEQTGGFQNGEFIVLAARTTIGKTSLAFNVARHCLLRGDPVFFVSLEMSREELGERLLCCDASVDSYCTRMGRMNTDDLQRIGESRRRLIGDGRAARFHIDAAPSQTVLKITTNARRLKRKFGIKLVIVDYLQLVEPESRRDNREQQVATISRRLKVLAADLNIPVVVLAQINREGESANERPRMRHIRESGAVEQDAHTVLILHRPSEHDPVHELYVDKQRNGPNGMVRLYFRKQYLRFEDAAWEAPIP